MDRYSLQTCKSGYALALFLLIFTLLPVSGAATGGISGLAGLVGNLIQQALNPCSDGISGNEALAAGALGAIGLRYITPKISPKGEALSEIAAQIAGQASDNVINGAI